MALCRPCSSVYSHASPPQPLDIECAYQHTLHATSTRPKYVYHTCTHCNLHIGPANDTATASQMAVQSLNPVYSPLCPTTAIRHCIRTAAHTSCDIPMTDMTCHASDTHVKPYMTPAHDTATGPHMALCRPCSSVYSHACSPTATNTSHAHGSTHNMQHPHDPNVCTTHAHISTPT